MSETPLEREARIRAYIAAHRGASWQRDREIDPAEYAEYWSRPRVSEMAVHTSFGLFLSGGYPHTADDLELA